MRIEEHDNTRIVSRNVIDRAHPTRHVIPRTAIMLLPTFGRNLKITKYEVELLHLLILLRMYIRTNLGKNKIVRELLVAFLPFGQKKEKALLVYIGTGINRAVVQVGLAETANMPVKQDSKQSLSTGETVLMVHARGNFFLVLTVLNYTKKKYRIR